MELMNIEGFNRQYMMCRGGLNSKNSIYRYIRQVITGNGTVTDVAVKVLAY